MWSKMAKSKKRNFGDTAVEGLSIYGRISAVLGAIVGVIVGITMFVLGILIFNGDIKNWDDGQGNPIDPPPPWTGPIVSLLGVVVGIFSVIWAIATFRSKSFAAVAGGIGVINTLFSR